MKKQHNYYVYDGYFVCECGKEFNNSQAYNGHKTHCKSHHLAKYGNLEFYDKLQKLQREQLNKNSKMYAKVNHEKAQLRKLEELTKWISEQHLCERCDKVMTERFGSGRFCSRTCANSRSLTNESREKISKTLQSINKNNIDAIERLRQLNKQIAITKYYNSPKRCVVCNQIIDYVRRHSKTCSDTCLDTLLRESGKKSSAKSVRRSKNEILFCGMCEKHFKSVRHNEPIFNGWDADIIIDDYKLAILWNGIWHYKQVMPNQTSSLKQIQTRDKIKLDEIEKCGYNIFIVKDVGRHKKEFINIKFQELLKFIENLNT